MKRFLFIASAILLFIILAPFSSAQNGSFIVAGDAIGDPNLVGTVRCEVEISGTNAEGDCSNRFIRIVLDNIYAETVDSVTYVKGWGTLDPEISQGSDANKVYFTDVAVSGDDLVNGNLTSGIFGTLYFPRGIVGPDLNVVHTYPFDQQTDVAPDQRVGIVFSTSVNTDTLEADISVSDGTNVLTGLIFNWSTSDDDTIVFIDHSGFSYSTIYTVTLTEATESSTGRVLDGGYSFSFTTVAQATGPVNPVVCGDGIIEGGEKCDDGDTDDNDGCSSTCQIENGYVCDSTPSECYPESLGPFTVIFASPANNSIDVPEDAKLTVIFNSAVDRSTFENSFTLTSEEGGVTGIGYTWLNNNSAVQIAHEEFDSNTVYTATVSGTVKAQDKRPLESSYIYRFTTVIPEAEISYDYCGNGLTETQQNETCDDGNRLDGDGCDLDCQTEDSWSCSGAPSFCVHENPACGNGILEADMYSYGYGYYPYGYYDTNWSLEECDDGNTVNGDGCDSSCRVETGFVQIGGICLVEGEPGQVAPSLVEFPALHTLFNVSTGERVLVGEYAFPLLGYNLASASWIAYNPQTKIFTITDLPNGLIPGEYLFTVKNISTGRIENATITVQDIAKFFDSDTGDSLINDWVLAILSAEEGEDPAGLGVKGKDAQIANLLALYIILGQIFNP